MTTRARHRLAKISAAVLILIVAIVLGVLLAWNAGLLCSSFIRVVSWKSGRPIEVRGALHVHLLTGRLSIEAEGVTIGNPTWFKPGVTADIATLTVTFASLWGHPSELSLLKIDNAKFHFTRDSNGHANWQRYESDTSPGRPLPMIREFELSHAHLTLLDERLHLDFSGDLSIAGPNSEQPLQIEGSGTLNDHPVSFHLKGAPLPSATPGKPYEFEFDERSSGVHLTAHASLPQPYDLSQVDADLDAGGADLHDLYYLLGIHLPNTGTFHAQARMKRRGTETLFDDLKVTSGESDVNGRVSLNTQKNGRTLAHIDLNSALLRSVDVGLRAAGRDPHPDAAPKLFSDVRLITPALRRVDVTGKYNARRLVLSRIEVTDLSAPFTVEHGLLKAPDVTGHSMGGKIALSLESDATQDPARSRVDLTITGVQLAVLPHKSEPPPYEGALQLKVRAQGKGDSLHALAAAADGNLSARVIQGTMRASLAELTGVDLRGLGLTLTGSGREVAVRCAAADFDIHAGAMRSTRLFIDSEPVFISGEGSVQLDSETVDLKMHGDPKRMRILRMKAPLLVQGTLLQPKFSVDVAGSALHLVDSGTPHDADCATLQNP